MKNILRESATHWKTHHAQRMGAALAYYAMLSFVPLLFLLTTIASILFAQDVVQGTLVIELTKIVGPGVAQYINQLLQVDSIQTISFTTAIVSALVTLFGAASVFAELDQDFDVLWETPKQPKVHQSLREHIWALVYKKIITLSFVPILATLLLVVIGATILVSAFGESTVLVLRLLAPIVLGTLLFSVIYRMLPERTLPWKILIFGGFVTTVLFVGGNVLILEYIRLLVHIDVFGPAASLVGLLVWVYYSAQVFFFGASFTYIYAKQKGLIPSREKVQS